MKTIPGGSSVHYHMLNVESRKYFNRAFSSSGSAMNLFVLRKENHIEQIQKCSQTNEIDEMITYLKTTSNLILGNCTVRGFYSDGGDPYPIWIPTIERANTKGAFLTQTPAEIYNSSFVPAMDVMFSLNSHVFKT